MFEDLFVNSLYALGFVAVISMIVSIVYGTQEAFRKMKIKKKLDQYLMKKLEAGDFDVLAVGQSERMENEEDHS